MHLQRSKSIVVTGTRAKTKLWYERVMENGIKVIIIKTAN